MRFTNSLVAALALTSAPTVAIPSNNHHNITFVPALISKFIIDNHARNATAAAVLTAEVIADSIADRQAQISATTTESETIAAIASQTTKMISKSTGDRGRPRKPGPRIITSKKIEDIRAAHNRNVTALASDITDGLEGAHAIEPREVAATAVTDPDDWRFFHYEGLRTGNDHWWRGGGSRVHEMKAAHEQVVTPTLPKVPKVPRPLLPTSDTQVLALYSLALAQFEAEEAKGMTEKRENLAQKKVDVAKFSRMNQCVHDKNFCKQLKFRDAPATSRYYKKYKKEYTQIFEKLKQEMQIEGLIELGKQLKEFMAETGQQM